MKITDEQKEMIRTRLRERSVRAKCPMCSLAKWELSDELIYLPKSASSAPAKAAQVICLSCGFTALHSLKVLDLESRF